MEAILIIKSHLNLFLELTGTKQWCSREQHGANYGILFVCFLVLLFFQN